MHVLWILGDLFGLEKSDLGWCFWTLEEMTCLEEVTVMSVSGPVGDDSF